jgi:hypothetical protein
MDANEVLAERREAKDVENLGRWLTTGPVEPKALCGTAHPSAELVVGALGESSQPGLIIGPSMVTRPGTAFRRDRLTWIAYALLAWFAYLQAAPGLVIAHLRDELDLSYSTGGLHVE